MHQVTPFGGSVGEHPRFSRRAFNGLCLLGACTLAMPSRGISAQPAAIPADRTFAIFREGDEIGRHEVRFAAGPDGLAVTTDIDIAIKVLFVTAFEFELSAQDVWQDGMLVESRIATNDNGQKSKTLILASGPSLMVEGGINDREVAVPLGTMTDIAFWNSDVIRQRALIDPQKVELSEVTTQARGRETLTLAGGRTIETERYTMTSGGKGRNGDIWFDEDGNWVKGVMIVRGQQLDYQLIA